MKLSEINDYVKTMSLEKKYNQSFNYRQINSPKTTFYSVEKINKFLDTNKKINYGEYYIFLNNEFMPKFQNFKEYLMHIVDIWKYREIDFNIDKDEALIYLAKKFIIDPINGKINELNAKKNIIKEFNKSFTNFNIEEPTPEQDMIECWDFKIFNNNITFYIQLKPNSFFYSLDKNSNFSFNKIKKSIEKNKIPIFLAKFENNKLLVCLFKNNSHYFSNIKNLLLFNSQDILLNNSIKIMELYIEEINNKKNKKNKI